MWFEAGGTYMKIAFVSRESFPLGICGQKGGIGRYVETTATALARNGVAVSVFSESPDSAYREQVVDGVLVHYLPKWMPDDSFDYLFRRVERFLFSLPYIGRQWAILSTKVRRSKIVAAHLHSLSKKIAWDCIEFADCGAEGFFYIVGKGDRLPCCVRVHGPTQMLCTFNNVQESLGWKLLIQAERLAARNAEKVTAPSEFAAQMGQHVWKLSKRYPDVVHNYIDSGIFCAPEKRQPNEKITILYTGRLQMGKGMSLLPELISLLAERGLCFEMRLAGSDTNTAPGGGSVKDWLVSTIPEEHLACVQFLGGLDCASLVKELQRADIGVYMSKCETFGYTCLEAQSCGLPVVTTNVGGTQEVIVSGETGVCVEPDNIEAVCSSILDLATDRELRLAFSERARENARDRFSVDDNICNLLDVYAKLAAMRGAEK